MFYVSIFHVSVFMNFIMFVVFYVLFFTWMQEKAAIINILILRMNQMTMSMKKVSLVIKLTELYHHTTQFPSAFRSFAVSFNSFWFYNHNLTVFVLSHSSFQTQQEGFFQ